MSVCTFLASDCPLPEVAPTKEYPVEINLDTCTIYDGGADDNFYLYTFADVQDYTAKKYAVQLEWNYTAGRAEQILNYIKQALEKTESVELWHVWLMDYYEYKESPVIHKRTVSAGELTIQDIYDLDHAEIWNSPDKYIPSRPSFYCLTIKPRY